jgi:hypothetical protein
VVNVVNGMNVVNVANVVNGANVGREFGMEGYGGNI